MRPRRNAQQPLLLDWITVPKPGWVGPSLKLSIFAYHEWRLYVPPIPEIPWVERYTQGVTEIQLPISQLLFGKDRDHAAKLAAEGKILTALEQLALVKPEKPKPNPRQVQHPLLLLRLRLAALHQVLKKGADDQLAAIASKPVEVDRMAVLLRNADHYLTGRVYTQPERYVRQAERVLWAESVTLRLSDAGYSRLVVSIPDSRLLWIDRGLSSPDVVRKWDEVFSAH